MPVTFFTPKSVAEDSQAQNFLTSPCALQPAGVCG